MVEVEKRISSIEAARPSIKKTYISPNLLEYGNIAKLTQNGNGSGADGTPTAGMMMVCL